MTARTSPRATAKPKGFRRFERWMIGVMFSVMAFTLEKFVMRSVRKKKGVADPAPAEEVTTVISKGGEVDVDLQSRPQS